MNEIYQIATNIYYLSLIPLSFISFFFYFLIVLKVIDKRKMRIKVDENFIPKISVHIPVFNDPIVLRCLKSCLNQDYPKDKYEIIVIDDSNDNLTGKIIDEYIKSLGKKGKIIKVIRRKERRGFKAGALNDALEISNGEIIVVLDSDSIVPKDFLRKIIQPFKDKKVVLVQSKQTYINKNQNIITKFATTLQSIYYNFFLKLFSSIGLTFCAGSAVAIRKEILKKFKWDEKSVTEDMDLSLKIFSTGYKTVYLEELKIKSEVPFKFSHFLKQQARWTFGICRAFIDNFDRILFSKNLKLFQKISLILVFISYPLGVFVFSFFISGILRILTDEPKQINVVDLLDFSLTFFITSGFLFIFIFAAKKERVKVNDIFLPLFLGLINNLNNLIFFFRAFFSKKFFWYKTPKLGNLRFKKFD